MPIDLAPMRIEALCAVTVEYTQKTIAASNEVLITRGFNSMIMKLKN
jgi:hypothetical protein